MSASPTLHTATPTLHDPGAILGEAERAEVEAAGSTRVTP